MTDPEPVSISEDEVDCAVRSEAGCGESPMWSAADQVLWWTDNIGRCIHRFDPVSGDDEVFDLPGNVWDIGLATDGLVLALTKSCARYRPGAEDPQVFAEVEQDRPGNRFNDGKVDRQGRFWAGTMDDEEWTNDSGALYRVGPDGRPDLVVDHVACANGLGWSPDDRTFYFGESFRYAIYAYDFEPASGALSNRRTFVELDRSGAGFPDGLTVDAEGGVWSAHNGAGRVVRYAPDGRATHVVRLPVPHPTSCMFGGADLDTLYVTTARQGMDDDALARSPLSGSVFAVRTGMAGLPEPTYAG